MSNKVVALPGLKTPGHAEPNQPLIDNLRDLLARAEAGELQSFVGTGFMADGCRLASWCDTHENIYEMHGALGWLLAEYVHRHTA
jgi:hypothetical protein